MSDRSADLNSVDSPDRRPLRPAWPAVILLAAAPALLYAQTASFEFVQYDDGVHVFDNEHVRSGLTWDNFTWAFGIHGPSQWHPLAWLSHQLDCELFGLEPAGHHLTNLGLHILSVVLLFMAIRRMTGRTQASAYVAMLFAIHPLNVESVAWVSERRNVLCAACWMASMWCYAVYCQKRSAGAYLAVLVTAALALMSKPLAVTLPCVFILLDFWPLRRCGRSQPSDSGEAIDSVAPRDAAMAGDSYKRLVLEKAPLFAMAVIAGVLTILCQKAEGVVQDLTTFRLSIRIENALVSYVEYLRKAVWPVDLAVFYPHPAVVDANPDSALALPAIISAAVIITVTLVAFLQRRRRGYLLTGWLWYLGVMFPMIGILQVGEQRLADRYAYLPLIGIFWAVVWLGGELLARLRKFVPAQVVRLVAAAPLIALPLPTWRQASTWRDTESLFSHAISVTESNYLAHNNLGHSHYLRGNRGMAARHYAAAISILPDYALAHFNLGVLYHDAGFLSEARSEFEKAAESRPDMAAARVRLAVTLFLTGRTDEALAQLERAIEIAPHYTSAHFNLGLIQREQGDSDSAANSFRRVLQIDPNHARARQLLEELDKTGRDDSR
ncbi:MAG: tetratricopeptide repeat protein [Planctomycetota bacterium]|nr:MAG: tetratricopeptide repeat protein [Planctomycetota bacterium]REJ88380.1 MAG: tetratricopeptide repeat protein [Planctomycetota bacterium]REK30658.1 MAG: tetratricopeptide repeat protein [Planctomycetota bacterium]REK33032.1 MAG: tetratricopeptide repeat protein [Planctomycetota bacterium]